MMARINASGKGFLTGLEHCAIAAAQKRRVAIRGLTRARGCGPITGSTGRERFMDIFKSRSPALAPCGGGIFHRRSLAGSDRGDARAGARQGGPRDLLAGGRAPTGTRIRSGQSLHVVAGIGRIQVWGGPVRVIRPGDTVWIPPGEKHWHGAAPDRAMTHIAISRAHRRGACGMARAGRRRPIRRRTAGQARRGVTSVNRRDCSGYRGRGGR